MVVTRELSGEYDDLLVGFEDEDTRIGGAGTYGDASAKAGGRAGLLPVDGHVRSFSVTKNPNKAGMWEVGSGRDFCDVDETVYEFDWNLEYIPRSFRNDTNFDAILASALGSVPSAAGVITLANQLGSFELEAGRNYDENSILDVVLAKGCITDTWSITHAERDYPVVTASGIARDADMSATAVQTRGAGDTLTDLTCPSSAVRRFHWADLTPAFSVGGVSAVLKEVTVEVANGLERVFAPGSRLTSRPYAKQRNITGSLAFHRVPGDTTLRDVFLAAADGAADAAYLDSVTLTWTKNSGAEFLAITLDDVWLTANEDAHSYNEGAGAPVPEGFDFISKTISVDVKTP